MYSPKDGIKDIRGSLKFKTVKISSQESSSFDLKIHDNIRNTDRTIAAKYTVNRNPMVYGDAKNMEIGISSESEDGFRINTVSYEGLITQRSKRK